MKALRSYHFHDTSSEAPVKQTQNIDDNFFLREDASNLAAYLYLYLLKQRAQPYYKNIVDTIRMVAPFFDDFILQPAPLNNSKIKLSWREKGSKEPRISLQANFDAHALSDGTLRFISLASLLFQPQLPPTILLDEPELGLHPYAIRLLSDLLRYATTKSQVIVCTQSVTLVNQFAPEEIEIIVVERQEGHSTFERLVPQDIALWLEEYDLGELWEKNVVGGRPSL
jgi:predicted ATPase